MTRYIPHCSVASMRVALLLSVLAMVVASRGRMRPNVSRLQKQGTCPAAEVINRLSNAVCNDNECELDDDCQRWLKCCRNSCGGKSCVSPIETQTERIPTNPPAVSEVDIQSGLLTVREGDTAVLYCNASSRVPTTYGWLLVQPGATLPAVSVFPPGSNIGNKRVTTDGRQLTVIGARIQDTANYACVASSLLGYVTKSYQLYVHAANRNSNSTLPQGSYDANVEEQKHITDPVSEQFHAAGNEEMPVEEGPGAAALPHMLGQYLPEISERIIATTTSSPLVSSVLFPTPVPSVHGGTVTGAALVNSVCQQPRDKGTCTREERRWFFNTSKGKCEPFTYSGCNGNLNNFRTYDECNRSCPNLPEHPCEQPIFTGPCRANFMRWGYDSSRGECVKFVYGGCRENGNNFKTRSKCVSQCIQSMVQDPAPVQEQLPSCQCAKPRLKNCFCSSEFAIEGTVIQKHNTNQGDILVVEVANVFKQGTLSLRQASTMNNNVTIIRDMSRVGRQCQCHTLEPNAHPYIIMGNVNPRGDAEIDSTSYVSEATRRRANKLETQNQRSHACKSATRTKTNKRSGTRSRPNTEDRS